MSAIFAAAANAVADGARYGGAPTLTEYSNVETLCGWLQWSDPNGCHTPELAAAEDFDPYTLEEAWDAIKDMLENEL